MAEPLLQENLVQRECVTTSARYDVSRVELEAVEAECQRRVHVTGVARQLGAAVVVPLRAAVAGGRATVAVVSICTLPGTILNPEP